MRARPVLQGARAFSAIVLGQGLSTLGSSMTRFGLGLWVFATTGDAAAYTKLLFFAVLPLGLGALVAGPLIDRLDRKRVMVTANVAASLSTVAIAALHYGGVLALWHLYVALVVNGLANAFVLPAFESSTPLLVPKEALPRAAGLTQMVRGVELILAPALAGLLIGRAGLGTVFIVDALTFVASLAALMISSVPSPPPSSGEGPSSLWTSFASGVRYIRVRPAFLYLLGFVTWIMFLLPGVGYALVTPLVLSFSTEEAAGLVISAFGFGSIVGGVALTAWGGPPRRMDGMLGAMVVAGVASVVLGARESVGWVGAALVVIGATFVFAIGLNRVIWQTKADPGVLGRIFSLRIALGVGAQSLGILVAGALAERVFEPLMASDHGALAATVGAVIGTGDGRGMALMFVLVGVILVVTTSVSAAVPAVRRFEDRLPDYAAADDVGEASSGLKQTS
ncbi:MAG: MFS transporter [Myxococcota bacterium]